LTEGVRSALEEMLAADGLQVKVAAVPSFEAGKMTTVAFRITDPPVVVGEIQTGAASAALDAKGSEILAKLTGSTYSTQASPNQISTGLATYYHDKGFLEAYVQASPHGTPLVAPDGIRIPFSVSVSPGTQYRILGIQLAAGLLVTQASFDRQSHIHPGEVADAPVVRENWQYIARQYHNHGYMRARVVPTQILDRAEGTVRFDVTVEPGQVYTMGSVKVENVSDDLRKAMLASWKVPVGAVFSEGALLAYYAIGDANPTLASVFASVNCKYVLELNDEARTVDVALRLEKKH
jgi:hypothetical protein